MAYCPICGAELISPARPGVAYPMHFCSVDGVVFDERRNLWYGFAEPPAQIHCPNCGLKLEGEPKDAPAMYFCFQCGVTYDRSRKEWYGMSLHVSKGD